MKYIFCTSFEKTNALSWIRDCHSFVTIDPKWDTFVQHQTFHEWHAPYCPPCTQLRYILYLTHCSPSALTKIHSLAVCPQPLFTCIHYTVNPYPWIRYIPCCPQAKENSQAKEVWYQCMLISLSLKGKNCPKQPQKSYKCLEISILKTYFFAVYILLKQHSSTL